MNQGNTKDAKAAVAALAITIGCMVLASCFLDAPTAPGEDLGSLEFAVTGDSVVLLGGTLQLTPDLLSGSGTGPSHVYWTSSDTSVATVWGHQDSTIPAREVAAISRHVSPTRRR